jgi:hypothetical protein
VSDNPFVKPITDVTMVQPRHGKVVLLHRVEPGVTPEYCIHGKVGCYRCGDWCWLGSETYKVVRSGEAVPICMECANEIYKEHPDAFSRPASEHLDDHRA